MKTEFIPLMSYSEDAICRGAILRFPAEYPYEETVEFMVCEQNDETLGFSLVVASGYKAGITANILPMESRSKNVMGIDTRWLIKNWCYWVYGKTPPEKVLIAIKRYV